MSEGCILCKGPSKFLVKDVDSTTATTSSTVPTASKTSTATAATAKSKANLAASAAQARLEQAGKAQQGKENNEAEHAAGKNRPAAAKDDSKKDGSKKETKKRQNGSKPPPAKRPKVTQQLPSNGIGQAHLANGGNGFLSSNPLHDVNNSKVAALLLSEENPTGSRRSSKHAGAAGKTSSSSKMLSRVSTTSESSDDTSCGVCGGSVDIWCNEASLVLCNRVSDCGATFHHECLAAHNYDLQIHDGCIVCEDKSKFIPKAPVAKSDLIVLDSDIEENADDDDVIVID